jgi:hypothetical protein
MKPRNLFMTLNVFLDSPLLLISEILSDSSRSITKERVGVFERS